MDCSIINNDDAGGVRTNTNDDGGDCNIINNDDGSGSKN